MCAKPVANILCYLHAVYHVPGKTGSACVIHSHWEEEQCAFSESYLLLLGFSESYMLLLGFSESYLMFLGAQSHHGGMKKSQQFLIVKGFP